MTCTGFPMISLQKNYTEKYVFFPKKACKILQLIFQRIGSAATRIISNSAQAKLHPLALETVRIIARDKSNVESLVSDELYSVVLQKVRLGKEANRTFPNDEDMLGK